MRGYQLPTIYLHYKKTEAAGLTRESYDIIDGQQRGPVEPQVNSHHRDSRGVNLGTYPPAKYLRDNP